jgi:hypothetical protein
VIRSDRNAGAWSGLLLAEFLALLFLAVCLWEVWRELEFKLPDHRITGSLSVEQALDSVLGWQLAAFGAALVLCHLLLGLAAFGLARLTEAAFASAFRRGWLVGGWFGLLAGLVLAANASWHPASIFSGGVSWLRGELLGGRPVDLLILACSAFILFLILRAVRRPNLGRPRLILALACAAALAPLAGMLPPAITASASVPTASASPNIVIVGLDSLRRDFTESRSGAVLTPNIDRFLADTHRFSDATSPLARTYGAWVSILTGRHPVTTNARVNLMPRRLVDPGITLADALQKRGYRTTYATDEVRFANFDRSFGFDELITPPVGAVDFLLGYAGDIPLVNLLATTAAGRLLFPSNHANRAAHVTYEPGDFVYRLERELDGDGPAFVAIHLTLPHWPYSWAELEKPTTPQQYRPAYREAVQEADRQFASVMQVLKSKGLLRNAVVVVLSDHGEALGLSNDSMLHATGTGPEIWNSLWGHGTSVMSPHQYGVLLAMRAYGSAKLPGAAAIHDWPVTLEDLRPTLEEIVTGTAPSDVDGISLLPLLADPALAASIDGRVRFTETDFNTRSMLAGRFGESGIIDEAAVFYELDPDSGWVQFRPERLPFLMAQKQRAAFSRDSLLAAIPKLAGGSVSWLFTDRHSPLPRRLTSRPDPAIDPEAARLWAALQARFRGELPDEPGPPLM